MARVLIVDDEEGILMTYGHIVSQMDHEVFTAKNAEEANAIVLTERDLDVVLVDRVFPGEKSGLDIVEFIRISQPLCQTVLMSGYPTFDSASEALRLGVFDYLTKPVTKEIFSQVIDAAVQEKILHEKKILDAEKNKKGYEELKTKQEMLQHDMRSLLIGIAGFSNLLISRTTLDETQLEYCNQIQLCSVQLENMINTYLDITNLEQETFQIEKSPFNILNAARQSRRALRFLADGKNVEISLIFNKKIASKDDVLMFEGNRMYFQNAVSNLLKNAIEASPQDRRVKIKIKNVGESISVGIHNWGTIPKDIHDAFFDKYVSSGKKGGVGLGTYMADLVVKAHRGQIDFETSKEKGTEVLMTLPKL
ncbi:MAG: response regulator [Deltaproteobacteria bacterium]|nr:response regulator [Deltaproteobacteria bacterium]